MTKQNYQLLTPTFELKKQSLSTKINSKLEVKLQPYLLQII